VSDTGTVRYETHGVVARITFDRASARNAMSWTMYDQLSDAIDRLESDTSIRVATLRGAHGHFVAGTDISQFESFTSGDDGIAYERRLESIVSRLETVRVPTVVVVEGNAAGAGLLFATACDFRVCTPDARFSAPIARTVGNTLSARSIARLVAHLGPSRTKLLIMTAGAVEAEAARAIGFVSAVVEPARLEQTRLSARSMAAGIFTKASLHSGKSVRRSGKAGEGFRRARSRTGVESGRRW
jgi:enoyl-CoA hydratase